VLVYEKKNEKWRGMNIMMKDHDDVVQQVKDGGIVDVVRHEGPIKKKKKKKGELRFL